MDNSNNKNLKASHNNNNNKNPVRNVNKTEKIM